MHSFSRIVTLGLLVVLPVLATADEKAVDKARAIAKKKAKSKVDEELRFLASDALEGRGVATEGIRKAAEYIRSEFKKAGLKSGVPDGSYYQKFTVRSAMQVKTGVLVLRGPEGQELKLKLGKDFQALSFGGSGKAKAELVFAGYGISAPDFKYDDYKDADVAKKIVVVIRREPQQGLEDSVFSGKAVTNHSYIRTKLAAAAKNKVAGVLMVNDPFSATDDKKDALVPPGLFGSSNVKVPFGQLKMAVLNKILAQTPLTDSEKKKLNSLANVAESIDKNLTPLTQALKGWTAEIDFNFSSVEAENVVGVLEGEGPLAQETVIVGAHYDHLGMGGFGSRARGRREVHNGADDNATGTVAVLELARRFAKSGKKPRRRIVFIAFSGEERGLIGSRHYVANPLFPLKDTIAMVNYDMIGMMRQNRVIVGGAGSAKEWSAFLDKAAEGTDLKLSKQTGAPGGSDQVPFYQRKIPVTHFFTGLTSLYHTPEDDYETLNVDGVEKIIDLSYRFTESVANMEKRPAFIAAPRRRRVVNRPQAYLGVFPDRVATVGKGVVVDDTADKSPAAKAGFKPGDVIVKFGKAKITDVDSLSKALSKHKVNDKVQVVVLRGGKETAVEVQLVRRQ